MGFCNMFKTSVARTNGFSNIVFGSVVTQMVLATLLLERSTVECVSSCLFENDVNTMLVATVFAVVVVEMMQTNGVSTCTKLMFLHHQFYNIFKTQVAKPHDLAHFRKSVAKTF